MNFKHDVQLLSVNEFPFKKDNGEDMVAYNAKVLAGDKIIKVKISKDLYGLMKDKKGEITGEFVVSAYNEKPTLELISVE